MIRLSFIFLLLTVTACGNDQGVEKFAKKAASEKSTAEKPTVAISAADYARTTKDGLGAVASVNPIATQAGIDAFAAGGNAIDAALAVAFTLGVVDSHNSGIGGGCFIVIRQADGTILAIDGREMAPAKAHRDMFKRDGKIDTALSKTGALAIGVPGSVAALYHAQKSGGKLPFAKVVLPAADIADAGFAVDMVFVPPVPVGEPFIAQCVFGETFSRHGVYFLEGKWIAFAGGRHPGAKRFGRYVSRASE